MPPIPQLDDPWKDHPIEDCGNKNHRKDDYRCPFPDVETLPVATVVRVMKKNSREITLWWHTSVSREDTLRRHTFVGHTDKHQKIT
ncbi:hypothetical protein QL285_078580 [Trifolium repens]|nr:hypothetical protein QL285_078580 [Trifolium repens]